DPSPRARLLHEARNHHGPGRFQRRSRTRSSSAAGSRLPALVRRAGRITTMRPEKAAFQGERGAFSEEAARRLLGRRVEVLPCMRFEDVFRNLSEKKVQAAVVPIENT